jgi:hypothetical protein
MVSVVSIPSTSVGTDDVTARNEWLLPDLLDLAPAMA